MDQELQDALTAQGFDATDITALTAQGITTAKVLAYSADDARKILRHKSTEIPEILGYQGRDEMIHRDDLVVR